MPEQLEFEDGFDGLPDNASTPEYEEPLPEWAEKRSEGNYMEPGAQLATRDGRRTGNAYVDRLESHKELGMLAVVVTDMGNSFRMTQRELVYQYYPPEYVMIIDEARRRRGVVVQHEVE